MKKYLLSLIALTLLLCEASFTGGGMAFAATSGSLGNGVGWTYTESGTTKTLTITYSGSGSGVMPNYSSTDHAPWYEHRTNITTLTIQSGVTVIGKYAFDGLTRLYTTNFQNSIITTIEEYAFNGCTYFSTFPMPSTSSFTTIKAHAFNGCTKPTSVTIPASVTTIGQDVFSGCSALKQVNWNAIECNNFAQSSYSPFYAVRTNITKFQIASNVTRIPNYLCYGMNNSSLTTLSIPSKVEYIGNNSFYGCSSVTSITIPASVTFVGASAFRNCSALKTVTFNSDCELSSMGTYVFSGCSLLYSAILPPTLTALPTKTFENCTALKNIILPPSISSVQNDAFSGCSSLACIVAERSTAPTLTSAVSGITPANVKLLVFSEEAMSSYQANTYWDQFDITTEIGGNCGSSGANATWTLDVVSGLLTISGTGAIANYSTSTVTPNFAPWYVYRAYINDIVINQGISTLGDAAFAQCEVETFTIPSSVTTINNSCFYSAKVNKLYYGGNITNWCNITLGTSNPLPTTQILYINDEEISDLELPNMSSLGARAFFNMKGIISVTIPNGMTSISTDAFSGCSNIANVYYQGSLAEWCAINFSNNEKANPAYNGAALHIDDSDIDGGAVFVKNDITSISNYAFCGVNNYTSIEINAATTLGAYTFKNCTAQILYRGSSSGTSGNVTWSWEDGVLTLGGSGTMNNYSSAANVPWTPYMASTHEIIVEDGITSIGNYAFNSPAASPITITLPSSGLTTIGNSSCGGLTALRELTIPNGVTTIGTNAFSNCINLEKIYCPATVPSLTNASAGSSFSTYNSFASNAPFYVLPASYSSYAGSAWTSFGSNYFVYGNCGASGDNVQWVLATKTGILTISGLGAMADYASATVMPWNSIKTNIQTIVIEDGVTTIGKHAFDGCNNANFTSIIIPPDIEIAGDYAFSNCTNLSSIHWNARNCTKYTASENFKYNCGPFYQLTTQITSFTFGDSVRVIPRYLCYNKSQIQSVTIPKNVTSVGFDAFEKCSNLHTINWNATNCDDFTSETAPFESIKTAITAFNFGHGVRHIPAYLCKDMNNITYPYSSTYGVTIPTTVESIGTDAFDGCTNFNRTDFKASNSYAITYVDDWGQINFANEKANPLYYSGHLYVVIPPSGQSTPGPGEVRTPVFKDTTTYINSYAFVNCSSITSVTFGSSMSSIAANAFAGCTGITSVTSNAVDAPTIVSNSFPASVKSSAPLTLVSCESKEDYLEDANWNFTTIYPNKVQFNLKGHGSQISSQCIAESEQVEEPSDPSADYYSFGGWFDNENCEGDAFDFSSEISADLTLYAKWTENVFSFADTDDDNSKIAAAYNKMASSITIGRTIWKDGYYNSMCLPFSLSADQIAASPLAGYKALKRLSEATVTGDGSERVLNIQLEPISEITAGEPFFISYDAGENIVNPVFDDVMVTTTAPSTIVEGDVTCRGLFYKNDIGAETTNLFVGENNTLYWPKEGKSMMKGFRAYFSINPASSAVARGMRVRFVDRMPTGVEKVSGERLDVNGKKILYEGQLFILRDGKTYNAQGALMK